MFLSSWLLQLKKLQFWLACRVDTNAPDSQMERKLGGGQILRTSVSTQRGGFSLFEQKVGLKHKSEIYLGWHTPTVSGQDQVKASERNLGWKLVSDLCCIFCTFCTCRRVRVYWGQRRQSQVHVVFCRLRLAKLPAGDWKGFRCWVWCWGNRQRC